MSETPSRLSTGQFILCGLDNFDQGGDRLELLGEGSARVRVEVERINPPPAPPNVPFL